MVFCHLYIKELRRMYDSEILWKTKLPEVLVVRLSAFPFSFFFFSFTGSAGSRTIGSAAVSSLVGGDLRPTTVKHVGLPGTWYLVTSIASSSNCQMQGTINSVRANLQSSRYQFLLIIAIQTLLMLVQRILPVHGGPSHIPHQNCVTIVTDAHLWSKGIPLKWPNGFDLLDCNVIDVTTRLNC